MRDQPLERPRFGWVVEPVALLGGATVAGVAGGTSQTGTQALDQEFPAMRTSMVPNMGFDSCGDFSLDIFLSPEAAD